jgi:hypothetical protein
MAQKIKTRTESDKSDIPTGNFIERSNMKSFQISTEISDA